MMSIFKNYINGVGKLKFFFLLFFLTLISASGYAQCTGRIYIDSFFQNPDSDEGPYYTNSKYKYVASWSKPVNGFYFPVTCSDLTSVEGLNSYVNNDVTWGSVAGTYNLIFGCGTSGATNCPSGVTVPVVVNQILKFNVTGGGCSSDGKSTINLDGSQSNLTYQLYNGSTLVSTKAGTGNPIPWSVTGYGDYTIKAVTNLNFPVDMNGTASVVNAPLITSASLSVLGGSETICSGASSFLVVNITGGTPPFHFGFLNDNPQAVTNYISGAHISVSPNATTTYQMAGDLIDVNGCRGYAPEQAVVTVASPPLPSIQGDPSACQNATVKFTTETGYSSYIWNIDGGTKVSGGSSSDNFITVSWSTTGDKSVGVSYFNGNCQTPMAYKSVHIDTPPSDISQIDGLAVNFVNEPVTLKIQGSTDATNFVWDGPSQPSNLDATWRTVLARSTVEGQQQVFTAKPVKNGCAGNPFDVKIDFLSTALKTDSITFYKSDFDAITPEEDDDPVGYVFFKKHSENYKYGGCISTYNPVTIIGKLDFGDYYNIGNTPFNVTVTAKFTPMYDIPGVGEPWTVDFKLDQSQNKVEQVFEKVLSNTPFQLKFIKVELISFTSSNPVAFNFIRLKVNYKEEDEIDVHTLGVALDPVALDEGKWEQTFTWSGCPDIPNYEFQLLYQPDVLSGTALPVLNLGADATWKDALTIYTESGSQKVRVALAEGTGNYYRRVRPIGNKAGGITEPINYGLWATSSSFHYKHPEEDSNWIYSRTFTEGNTISEQVTYANGLQQVAQQETRIQSQDQRQDQIVASQTVQDYVGRNALTSLPIPVKDITSLGYIKKLLKTGSGDASASYSAADFDADDKLYNPTLAYDKTDYYSGTDNNINAGVASAENYPYSRTVFTNDGTGRVQEQGGVGKTHSLKGGKTIKTYYSNPEEAELVQLFGAEAPGINSVLKITTFDANGVGNVVYQNKDGKVIATALVATGDDGRLDKIGKDTDIKKITSLVTGASQLDKYTVVSKKPLFFSTQTDVDVDYTIDPVVLRELCNDVNGTVVGHYSFDNNSKDESGKGNNAVLHGATVTADGFGGSAYALNGTSSYLEILNSADFYFGAGDFTISYWIKRNSSATGVLNIAGMGMWQDDATPALNAWNLGFDNGNRPVFSISDGLQNYSVVSNDPVQEGLWYHLTGVRQGNSLTIYINGTVRNTYDLGTGAISMNNINASVFIGKLKSSYANGTFDEIQIYNRSLASTEVNTLYQQRSIICKTCDYKVKFTLSKSDDPSYSNTDLPDEPLLISANLCSDATSQSASFTLNDLKPNVNYVLEKRISINNQNNAGQLYIDERAANLRTFYETQYNLELDPIRAFLTSATDPDLKALYKYLDDNHYAFDAKNNQYIIPLGQQAGSCLDFVFIPKLALCESEGDSYDASCNLIDDSGNLSFTAYFRKKNPNFSDIANGKLTYAFFKNKYTNTNQYFAEDEFNSMMTNLIAENGASQNLTCKDVWDLWKREVAVYVARADINLSNSDPDNVDPDFNLSDLPQVVPGENNIYDNFMASLDAKLTADHDAEEQRLKLTNPNATINICDAYPGFTWFIKKTKLYGFINGVEIDNSIDSDIPDKKLDIEHVYRLAYYNEPPNVNFDLKRKFLQAIGYTPQNIDVTTPINESNFTTFEGDCRAYDYARSAQTMGDLQTPDAELHQDRNDVISEKITAKCGETCESRSEEFRQAIIQNIFSQNPTAKIEHYRVAQNPSLVVNSNSSELLYVGVYDSTVNDNVTVDYSKCELDVMVDALVQNCKKNYCSFSGDATTLVQSENIQKVLSYNFDVKVNPIGQTCETGYDAVVPADDTNDILDEFIYGSNLGSPSSPTAFNKVFTVTNALSSGSGSLVDAITLANNYSNSNPTQSILINFSIAQSLPIQINVNVDLSVTAKNITIDGTTQPGFNSTNGPAIKLNFTSTSNTLASNFYFKWADNAVVKGLYMLLHKPLLVEDLTNMKIIGNVFTPPSAFGITSAITLSDLSDNIQIKGNIIGRNFDLESTSSGFFYYGVEADDASNVTIGGESDIDSNIIYAGTTIHIHGSGDQTSSTAVILNNRLIFQATAVEIAAEVSPNQTSNVEIHKNLGNYQDGGDAGPFVNFISLTGTLTNTQTAPTLSPLSQSTDQKVTGTATPNSIVEVYVVELVPIQNSTRKATNVVKYLGTAVVNADGTFSFDYSVGSPFKEDDLYIGVISNLQNYLPSRLVLSSDAIVPDCELNHSLCFKFTTPQSTTITIPTSMDGYVDDPQIVPCAIASAASVLGTINEQVEELLDGRESRLRDQYETCANPGRIKDRLVISYNTGIYHHTLYYYDRAGNLMRTVPPEGVDYLNVSDGPNKTTTVNLDLARNGFPAHRLVTTYIYNSLGQLIHTHTPDANALTPPVQNAPLSPSTYYSSSIYSSIGQLRFSRNAKQKGEGKYSYTRYDELGRVIEVGESTGYNEALLTSKRDDMSFPTNTSTTSISQVTHTVYTDEFPSDTPPFTFPAGYSQENLRNRVSYTYLDQDGKDGSAIDDRSYTVYNYDVHGNVNWLVQKIPGMVNPIVIEYEYDLISGKVLQVSYNPGKEDQFFHKYSYDANNRLTYVQTSYDGHIWERDAAYEYYLHGPLKRTRIGEDLVQGLDYTYTIEGWLKAINHPLLDITSDPVDPHISGSDLLKPIQPKDGYSQGNGTPANPSSQVARDAFGMALSYYNGDYTHTGSSLMSGLVAPDPAHNLYNGNIASWTSNMNFLDDVKYYKGLTGQQFVYDELNRIKTSTMVSGGSSVNDYKSTYTYDGNGNILTQTNSGSGFVMDDLKYHYNVDANGRVINNKLNYVDEFADANGNDKDMEDQASNNYTYDAIGNLVADRQQNIFKIEWTPYGKIWRVTKTDNSSTEFGYDASGNRIFKKNVSVVGKDETQFYVRDAGGNTMAVYSKTIQAGNSAYELTLNEMSIYGSDRLGILKRSVTIDETIDQVALLPNEARVTTPEATKNAYEDVSYLANPGVTITLGAGFSFTSSAADNTEFSVRTSAANTEAVVAGMFTREVGDRVYELKDHLGNVRSTLTDIKLSQWNATEGVFENFTADVIGSYNYYPFGLEMPDRNASIADTYRYGFNGKERDKNEWGTTNYDYGFRIYNPALGRFLSVDPLTKSYPWYTPYQFAGNTPVFSIDLDGLENYYYQLKLIDDQGKSKFAVVYTGESNSILPDFIEPDWHNLRNEDGSLFEFGFHSKEELMSFIHGKTLDELNQASADFLEDEIQDAAETVWAFELSDQVADFEKNTILDNPSPDEFDADLLPPIRSRTNKIKSNVKSTQNASVTAPSQTIPKYAYSKYTRLTPKTKAAVLKKDPKCVYCRIKVSTTVDHITSQKQDWVTGGWKDSKSVRSKRVNNMVNLAGACRGCNSGKGSKILYKEWLPPWLRK